MGEDMLHEDQDAAKQLRERAEASIIQRSLDMPELSAGQFDKLLHELQVHQIELEIQD